MRWLIYYECVLFGTVCRCAYSTYRRSVILAVSSAKNITRKIFERGGFSIFLAKPGSIIINLYNKVSTEKPNIDGPMAHLSPPWLRHRGLLSYKPVEKIKRFLR